MEDSTVTTRLHSELVEKMVYHAASDRNQVEPIAEPSSVAAQTASGEGVFCGDLRVGNRQSIFNYHTPRNRDVEIGAER